MVQLVLLLSASFVVGARSQAACSSYFDIQKAAQAVTAACGPGFGQGASGFPAKCSPTCGAAFNSWFKGGKGACFTAMKLPPKDSANFYKFATRCSGLGGSCPPPPTCAGKTVEDRFVLVDKKMSWNDAREYCKSRYQELASIHSKEDQQIAMAKCATRSKPNKCEDRWESTKTCCADAVPKCLPGNNQNSDGSNGCWIGLHQPFGHGEREVVAFDNRQQCNVDQRMPGHLLDIEISKIRVETVGGKTHMWSPEDGYFLSKEDGCTFKGHDCVCRLRCPEGYSRSPKDESICIKGKLKCNLGWCHGLSNKDAHHVPRCKSPQVTLRNLLLGKWHGVSTENDLYKVIAGKDKNPQKNLYMFDDGDAGNYISTKPGSDKCSAGEFPCCQDPSKQSVSSFGKRTYSSCQSNGCSKGKTRQSNCPGTPVGLISMGPTDKSSGVPSGDFGECSYRTDWPWVVRAMWVTPSPAAGEQNTFVWSDGSAVDYSHWFGGLHGEGSGRSNEDEVEIRMGCDSWACFKGTWNDNRNGWARPFLCETKTPKYKLVDIPMAWNDALKYCRTHYGDLASIHSVEDQDDAANACAMRTGGNPCTDRYHDSRTCRGTAGCWIGLHEPESEGKMAWSDGSHVDYTNWFPHEPNDSGHQEDEVELRKWNDNNGGTAENGIKGAVKQPFLCTGRARPGDNGH